MPHLIVEHTANLSRSHDMAALAQKMSDAAMASGIFPLAGVRVRMHPVDTYSVADGHTDNAFVAVIMRIGAGRELVARQQAGQLVFDCVCDYFSDELERGIMAISLDMEINDPDMTFKRNGIADRLNKKGA